MAVSRPSLTPRAIRRRTSKLDDVANLLDNEECGGFVKVGSKGYTGQPKQKPASNDRGSVVRSSFRKLYRTSRTFTIDRDHTMMNSSSQADDEYNSHGNATRRPMTAPIDRSSLKYGNLWSNMGIGIGNSAPDLLEVPSMDFVKSMKHYCVPAPKTEWVRLLCRLFDETLLHPHALVYCDEKMAHAKRFQAEVNKHNLLVSDYSSSGSNSREVPCELPGSTSDNQDQSDQELGDNIRQLLVTNPKFSCQLSMPVLSCIFHMGKFNDSPLSYGTRLFPVDEKCAWDSISVLFIEPQDTKTASDIEKAFDIRFKEIPFDVPEISYNPKSSWKRGSVRRSRWWSM